MFRLKGAVASTSSLLLVSHIPRSAWDPAHYHENWTDSYGTAIAERRQWPSKRWSVGLEPSTPREWLQYSPRNLAYAYNAALRACGSDFSKMVALYKEMKVRGVKVDVDTLHILLTRGARDEKVAPDDLFLLLEELLQLGARPDMAAIETLHTVWDHSRGMPVEWREVRQKQLIQWYHAIAFETIERLSHVGHPRHQLAPHLDALLAQEINRVRGNLKQLNARLSPRVYRKYFHVIQSSSLLLRELHQFLWEFVAPDHPAIFIRGLNLRFPFIGSVMRRPPLPETDTTPTRGRSSSSSRSGPDTSPSASDGPTRSRAAQAILNAVAKSSATTSPSLTTTTTASSPLLLPSQFEDVAVCDVFLAAVERLVEADFSMDQLQSSSLSSRRLLHRRLFLSLLSILESTGVLFTADLMAQLMDVVKYSEEEQARDADARRVLRYALRGSCASRQEDVRHAWLSLQPVADGRVVGRYIASRHPWTMTVIMCGRNLNFRDTYPRAGRTRSLSTTSDKDSEAAPTEESEIGKEKGTESEPAITPAPATTSPPSGPALVEQWYTVEGFERRWNDIKALIVFTGVLRSPIPSYVLEGSSSRLLQPTAAHRRTGGAGEEVGRFHKMGNNKKESEQGALHVARPLRGAFSLHERMALVHEGLEAAMEVFTGQIVFLRTLVTGHRYESLDEALHIQASGVDCVVPDENGEVALRGSTSMKAIEGGGARRAANAGAAAPWPQGGHSSVLGSIPVFSFRLWERIFRALDETYTSMEQFLAHYQHCPLLSSPMTSSSASQNVVEGSNQEKWKGASEEDVGVASSCPLYTPPEPEFECWEGMLIILHSILDYCTAARQHAAGGVSLSLTGQGSPRSGTSSAEGWEHHSTVNEEGVEEDHVDLNGINDLFTEAAALRTRLVEESRTRFNGRFRILWLHEV